MYAFRSGSHCAVYVGSNNLTQSGLFQNEELSGLLSEDLGGPLERSLNNYIRDLTDGKTGLVRPLDDASIDLLLARGYVAPEAKLAGKTTTRARRTEKGAPLFGSRYTRPPRPPRGGPKDVDIEPPLVNIPGVWRRIFLRLRLARGTQAQIPLDVVRAIRERLGLTPIDGSLSVVLRNDDTTQDISPTYTKRRPNVPNTYKFEAFNPSGDALVKIELIGARVFVEKIDSAEAVGASILEYLQEGLTSVPRRTEQTTSDISHATLYRFD